MNPRIKLPARSKISRKNAGVQGPFCFTCALALILILVMERMKDADYACGPEGVREV